MLIWLDPAVATAVATTNHQLGLKELARAIRLGHHLVLGAPRTLMALREDQSLDTSDRAQFGWAASRVVDLSPLRRQVSVYLEVVAGAAAPTVSPVNRQTVWKVGIDWLGAGDGRTGRSRLFAEANDDDALYAILANTLGPGPGRTPAGLGAAFQFVSLGGGNVRAIWPQARDGSPALGVVDSDRSGPGGAQGSTATGATEADKAMATRGCPRALYVLEAREAENLLPLRLLGEATTGEAHRRAGLTGVTPYVDLKETIAKDLLGRVLAHLKALSPQKQRETLQGACTQSDRTLPGLLYAWGLNFRPGAASGGSPPIR